MKHGIDYWNEIELVMPTLEIIAAKQNEDIKFEASVIASSLILPEDKILPPDDVELSLLELHLRVPESGLLFRAYSLVDVYISGVGNLRISKKNLDAAWWLNNEINSGEYSVGVFGGKINLAETLRSESKYVSLQLGYAEFPKGSKIVYLFNGSAFLTSCPRKF